MNIFDKVKECILRCLEDADANDITINSRLRDDLFADSLEIFEIRTEIEKEFNFEFDDSELNSLLAINTICAVIEKRGLK